LGPKKLAQRGYPSVKVLCLDEITLHKGHGGYLLVISAPELGLVLDILPDRHKESLLAWLDERGAAWCGQVEVCCSDMWDAYHEAARAKLPNARRVVDRFHVMNNLNDALSQARRAIQRQADQATRAVLKGCRWLLVKGREHLTDEERQQLEGMLAASPELRRCYELKEAFREWFNQSGERQVAEAGLVKWLGQVEASGLKALAAFTRTLENWWEPILNYFEGGHSNGFAEGVNLKLKLIHRRAFGYRNFVHFRLHALVAFGPLSR
jgi:transposase